LDVPMAAKENGIELLAWNCGGTSNQMWKLDSSRRLVNQNSNSCVHVKDNLVDNGTPLVQWECGTGANQYWTLKSNEQLSPDSAPTKCMNAAGATIENGAKIILWDCVDQPNNKWFFG